MTEKLAAVTAKLEAQGRITDMDCKEYLLENRQRPRETTNNRGKDNNKVSDRDLISIHLSFFSTSHLGA